MKTSTSIFMIVCVILLALVVGVAKTQNAMAQAPTPDPALTETTGPTQETPTEEFGFQDLLVQLAGLTGFSALISFLINIGKQFNIVKDGQAGIFSSVLNLLLLIGLLAARVFRPDIDIAGLDKQAAAFVSVGIVVFGYILQLLAGKGTQLAVRGLPVVGKSFSTPTQ